MVQYVQNGFFINSFNTKYIKFLLTSKSDSKLYTVEPLISNPQRPGCDWNTKKLKSEKQKTLFTRSTTSMLVEKHAYETNKVKRNLQQSRSKNIAVALHTLFKIGTELGNDFRYWFQVSTEGSRGRLCRSRI